jgi:hypothetical protein
MEPLSSLHLLAEAVRNAGADIAPTYQEYIHWHLPLPPTAEKQDGMIF